MEKLFVSFRVGKVFEQMYSDGSSICNEYVNEKDKALDGDAISYKDFFTIYAKEPDGCEMALIDTEIKGKADVICSFLNRAMKCWDKCEFLLSEEKIVEEELDRQLKYHVEPDYRVKE